MGYYEYDTYGNQKNSVDMDEYNPYRYAGEYYDAASGFIYLRNRFYNPETGRFINEDPIRDGLNWYAYCGNNPVNFIDPTGTTTMYLDWVVNNGEECWDLLETIFKYGISYYAVKEAIDNSGLIVTIEITREGSIDGRLVGNWGKLSTNNKGGSEDIVIGLGDIASGYDIFECEAAAIAMAEYLKKQKQDYKFITMYYPSGGTIISLSREAIFGVDSKASRISVNGYHYGIEYNGIVHCNVHPYGLPREVWEADFWGVGQAFRTVTPP